MLLAPVLRAARAIVPGKRIGQKSYRLTSLNGNAVWGLAIALTLSACGGNIPPIPWPVPSPTPCPPGEHSETFFGVPVCVPNPIPEPTPEPTPTPTPTPEPTPEPTPTPTPPSDDNYWKETDDNDKCVRVGEDGLYRVDVELALDQAGLSWPTGLREAQVYAKMAPYLQTMGYQTALYGEELAVSNQKSFSENYDLVLATGARRTGSSTYRSTCRPATRSAILDTGTIPIPESPYPYRVDKITIKWHNGWADGTALHCGTPNASFPGRQCWPACGPDGPGRVECDKSLNPYWEGPGKNHPTNPWMFRPTASCRVCTRTIDVALTVRTVCSPFLAQQ